MKKGIKMSLESRKKMSNSAKGKIISIETRKKLSEALKGRTPWNKGKKVNYSPNRGKKTSPETKQKISEALKKIGHKPQNSNKWKSPNLGILHSEETKNKIREKAIGRKMSPYAREIAIITLRANRWKVKSPKGADSPRWKGGITKLRDKIWSSIKTKQWRTSVFERDNYTCVWCKQIGGKIEVDHIVPFSFILKKYNINTLEESYNCKDLWDINNGRTLCKDCHKKTDTYMYRAKSYVEKKCTK